VCSVVAEQRSLSFASGDSTPAKPHGRQPVEAPQYTLVHYSTIYSLLYTAQYTLVKALTMNECEE